VRVCGRWGEGWGGVCEVLYIAARWLSAEAMEQKGEGGRGRAREEGMRERERRRILRRRLGEVRSIGGGECQCGAAPFEIRWKWAAAEGGGPELGIFEPNFGI
jgi:hypothetical protein